MAVVTEGAVTTVLTLNSGSSTLKYGLYGVQADGATPLAAGTIETSDGDGTLDEVQAHLQRNSAPPPTVIGHRIVHGGPHRTSHCLIDDQVMRDLEAACVFAPVHGPAALALIEAARVHYPGLPQVACFDTAFHATMPEIASTLPIPRAYRAGGIRRYGFHGLSCQSIVHQFGGAVPVRLVIAHLGSGSSVTAVLRGRSIDTSMGLTPSGGVVMETRTGDIDPGVLLHLLREHRLDPAALADMVDHASGMLGLSGVSGDMRHLRTVADDAACTLAVSIFERSVSKTISAMMASLGGVADVILTGGIGENDAALADAVRADLGWIPNLSLAAMPSRENEEIALATASLV